MEQKWLLRTVLTAGAILTVGWLGHTVFHLFRGLGHLIAAAL